MVQVHKHAGWSKQNIGSEHNYMFIILMSVFLVEAQVSMINCQKINICRKNYEVCMKCLPTVCQMQSLSIYTKTANCEKGCKKARVEKVNKSKEMATMMLIPIIFVGISIIAAISWPPLSIS